MTTYMIALGLICWLTTNIVVDSELLRPLRVWVSDQKYKARHGKPRVKISSFSNSLQSFGEAIERMLRGVQNPAHPRAFAVWDKVNYLLTCHLCAGTWIALALVTVQPDARPFGTGLVGWLLAGLIVKAIAHVILEAVAWLKWEPKDPPAPVTNNYYGNERPTQRYPSGGIFRDYSGT